MPSTSPEKNLARRNSTLGTFGGATKFPSIFESREITPSPA
jgi:hypothetical protein